MLQTFAYFTAVDFTVWKAGAMIHKHSLKDFYSLRYVIPLNFDEVLPDDQPGC